MKGIIRFMKRNIRFTKRVPSPHAAVWTAIDSTRMVARLEPMERRAAKRRNEYPTPRVGPRATLRGAGEAPPAPSSPRPRRRDNPDDLEALILTAPAGFEEFSKKETAWLKSVFTVGLVKATTEDAIWGTVRRNNFYRWRPELEWLIEERVRVAKAPDFDQYAYANVKSVHALAENDFVRENLDKITVPTLIIYGDRDRLIPNPFMHGGPTDEVMEFGHARIQGSKLVALEDCGHAVQMDCSTDYIEEVRSFLGSLGDAQVAKASRERSRRP
jgi:pimeloyl-ACP methyl ester carboxylesterase